MTNETGTVSFAIENASVLNKKSGRAWISLNRKSKDIFCMKKAGNPDWEHMHIEINQFAHRP